MPVPFERSVFINCAFDDDFAPILQSIAFATVALGFFPRLAPENADNAANRLGRIIELIRDSRWGIHDLSRCKSSAANEFARMNMPFELGLDHACRLYGGHAHQTKQILVLEHSRYDSQKALSDIAGWDIEPHGGDYEVAVRKVRNWLVRQAGAPEIGAAAIQGRYAAFQEWYWERELGRGASEEDIREYPTAYFVKAMHEWVTAGEPL